jgi:flagellar protein FlaG
MEIAATQASSPADDLTAQDASAVKIAVKNADKSIVQENSSVSNDSKISDKKIESQTELAKEHLEREQLESVAQQLQDFMQSMNRSVQFQVDDDSGRDVIRVLDKQSGEVIKQYPSEEVLGLVSKLSQSAGLLVDQEV